MHIAKLSLFICGAWILTENVLLFIGLILLMMALFQLTELYIRRQLSHFQLDDDISEHLLNVGYPPEILFLRKLIGK